MDELDLSLVEEEIIETQEICGALFYNDAGEYAMCVLHRHPPQTGHCDGIDLCEDYCGDPVTELCQSVGLMDAHGMPTLDYFEMFEAV